MKTLGVLLFFLCSYSTFSQGYGLMPLNNQMNCGRSLEMGKRYLKLGFSWIGMGNHHNAEEYLTRGLETVTCYGDKYWEAVGSEFFGYLYLARCDKSAAMEWLNKAQRLYNKYGTLPNGEGSNRAISGLIESIRNNDQTIFSNCDDSQNNSDEYNDLLQKYNKAIQERDDFRAELTKLQNDIMNLNNMNIALQKKIDNLIDEIKELKSPLAKTGDIPISSTQEQWSAEGTQQPQNRNPWEDKENNESTTSTSNLFVHQAGIGNVYNIETKFEFGRIEVGGFVVDRRGADVIYGAILTYEVYKGKDWDAPFDLTVGQSAASKSPVVDGYAGFRYYINENTGVYIKAGYNMSYVVELAPKSYMNFSLGIVFRH